MLTMLARTFMIATRMDGVAGAGAGEAPAAYVAAPAHPRRAGLADGLATAFGRLFG